MHAPEFPVLTFHQYASFDGDDDELLMFAAPAKDIWRWAGIPRKGWRVRMLYQRWITETRKQDVTAFWNQVSTPREDQPKRFLVGPTALTIALQSPAVVQNGRITLQYDRPFNIDTPNEEALQASAAVVLERMLPRLDAEEAAILKEVGAASGRSLDFGTDYVLESLAQIQEMARDPSHFVASNQLSAEDVAELTESLEALCRPALVVDGQHRLYGAAHADREVWLPVVAMPNSPWMEQIYQFVVINEKAQPVETSLLTDIFGSSLTPAEQGVIRKQLDRAGARVDERIAAVVASRDAGSPFRDMVKLNLSGTSSSAVGIIPEATIRQLIEGGRGARGWRADPEFYSEFIASTYPVEATWSSWTEGAWKDYWFAFWKEVAEHYNSLSGNEPLWTSGKQSNLTKAVALRLLQRLFMEKCVDRIAKVKDNRETLVDLLGNEEQADRVLADKLREVALPVDVSEFRRFVREWFLEKGIPVKVFSKPWVGSLDDSDGQSRLYEEFEDAIDCAQKGKIYHARNKYVFAVDK